MVTVKKKEVKGYLLGRSGFAAKALAKITNEFHEDNKIGDFQFGEIYRGTSREEEVTVKIWKDESKYEMRPGDNQSRFSDETQLLEHFIKTESHPSLAKLRGVSTDSKILAIIYHLKTVNSVHNLLEKDSFTWEQRIKVALGFASLLEFMHAENPPYMPCLIRNIHAAHILLNEDYKPVLIDYSMLSGGILTDRRHIVNQYLKGCHGYVDPVVAHRGEWSDKSDVFSYGVLLLALISKRIPEEEGELTENKHKPQNSMMSFTEHKSSVVHQSLEFEPYFYSSDGVKVAKLAIKCMQYDPQKRPTMKQVVRYLQNLCIVRRHSNELNIHKILGDDEIVLRTDNRSEKESKLIPAWRWEYFSKSINLKRLSYRDKGGPNHGPAGKRSSGAEYEKIKVFSYEELKMFTNGFSEGNLMGKFQFGKLFRGKINERKVIVKIWEYPEMYKVFEGDNEGRLRDEIELLQHPKLIGHPNLVKLVGYCYDEQQLGTVYDLDALGSIYELAPKGCFTWLHRIKVAYEFACLLKFLHIRNPPYQSCLVRNIDAAHIMLDKEYTPKLLDFGMFTGGIILDMRFDRNMYLGGCFGYMDPCLIQGGTWAEESDVYAYGIVLLGLISKKICTEEDIKNDATFIREWARSQYYSTSSEEGSSQYDSTSSEEGSSQRRCSLVDCSLEADPGFDAKDGAELTKLAMRCIEMKQYKRPSMKQVVKRLLNLRVMRNHSEELVTKHKNSWLERTPVLF